MNVIMYLQDCAHVCVCVYVCVYIRGHVVQLTDPEVPKETIVKRIIAMVS